MSALNFSDSSIFISLFFCLLIFRFKIAHLLYVILFITIFFLNVFSKVIITFFFSFVFCLFNSKHYLCFQFALILHLRVAASQIVSLTEKNRWVKIGLMTIYFFHEIDKFLQFQSSGSWLLNLK